MPDRPASSSAHVAMTAVPATTLAVSHRPLCTPAQEKSNSCHASALSHGTHTRTCALKCEVQEGVPG